MSIRAAQIEKDSPSQDQTKDRKSTVGWYLSLLVNGNLKEKIGKGSLEVSDYPMPEDVEMALIESNIFPAGKYKVEKRINGAIKESFYCVKPDSSFFQQKTSSQINEVEQTEDNFDEDFDEEDLNKPVFDINEEIQSRAELIALKREIQEMKRQERERVEHAQNSQSEVLQMMREMQKQSEKSFQQGREQGLEMMKMFMQFQSQPQQNPQETILGLLKETLAVQRGVRELSEEIAPPKAESGSIFDGAANLIDSISRNAPKILPVVAGLTGIKPSAILPAVASSKTAIGPANGNGASGETSNLSEMFSKIKVTEKDEK